MSVQSRDKDLEMWWDQLSNVPFDDDVHKDMTCAENIQFIKDGMIVIEFPVGTERGEIWSWFNLHYSKGVTELMYI